MTQVDIIQTLWVAIEKRDKAIAEEDANIRKSYDAGNTNVDAYRNKRSLLRAELNALHEVLTTIQGCESRMQVVDAYYGQPWDHDEFRYQGRVVTGIEESRDSSYFILYLEVTDECEVTGNTWLNRKPIPPRESQPATRPAKPLTATQRKALEALVKHPVGDVPTSNFNSEYCVALPTAKALVQRKYAEWAGEIRAMARIRITDAGRKALEGAK